MNLDPEGSTQNDALTLTHLQEMDWKHFEILCRDYYRATGSQASLTGIGADGGVDVVLEHENPAGHKLTSYIQCKAWSHQKVGVKSIRELYGVMASDGITSGIFITASDFTRDAIAFTKGKNLQLISGVKLLGLIQELLPEQQQQLKCDALKGNYTTPTCPSCDIKMVVRTSSKGKNKGEKFWGCMHFPQCRQRLYIKTNSASSESSSINTLRSLTATIANNAHINRNIKNDAEELRADRRQYLRKKPARKKPGVFTKLLLAGGFGIVVVALVVNIFSWIFSSFQDSLTSQNNAVTQKKREQLVQHKNEPVREPEKNTNVQIKDQPVITKEILTGAATTLTHKPVPASSPVGLSTQQRLTQQEWRSKQQAWNGWYKQPWDCQNWRSDDHMVECTNHKMKAKREFERLWKQGAFSRQ